MMSAILSTILLQETGELRIPRPKGVDESLWSRLIEGYTAEKEAFVRLLLDMDLQRINPTATTLGECLDKMVGLQNAVNHFSEGVTSSFSPWRWSLHQEAFRFECTPRLEGEIVPWAPGTPCPGIRSGMLIELGPGNYKLHDDTFQDELGDVAFVGPGPDQTKFVFDHCALETGKRVQISGVTLDCGNGPFLDARDGSSIYLKNCRIVNYNSGAGGSNAIFAAGCILLVEECQFDGTEGRAAPDSYGDAFDLRGENFLFVWKTRFNNNHEILRASFPCVFDQCEAMSSSEWGKGPTPYRPGSCFIRGHGLISQGSIPSIVMTVSPHDVEFANHASDETPQMDEESRLLATKLGIRRNLPYWIALLLHESPEVRECAVDHLEKITDLRVTRLGLGSEITRDEKEKWLVDLEDEKPTVREGAANAIRARGKATLGWLRSLGHEGSVERRARVRQLIEEIERDLKLGNLREFGRLARWFETTRDRLVWDEKASRYSLK
jgi:hypothetical protein